VLQAQSLAHLNCPSCHNSIWAPYPQPNMQTPPYGHDHHQDHLNNYRSQQAIPRSNSTVSVNVPYAEYEHRRQMEMQQQKQQQQWELQRAQSAHHQYHSRGGMRAPSPAPSNKSNKSRTKSLPGTGYGRRTTTSESEEDGHEDENCEEFCSSSQPHEESDEEIQREPEVAPYKWECEHCTYINPEGTRVCAICCKTPTGNFRMAPSEVPVPNSLRRITKPSIRRGSAKQQIAARRRQEQELRAREEAQERRRFRQLENEVESESLDDDYAAIKRSGSRPSSRKSSRSYENEPYKSLKVKSESIKARSKENHEIIRPEPIRYAPPPPPEVVEKKGKEKENKLQPAIVDKKTSSTDEDNIKPTKKKKRISFWFGSHFSAFKKHEK
jgi:hypothetical protein